VKTWRLRQDTALEKALDQLFYPAHYRTVPLMLQQLDGSWLKADKPIMSAALPLPLPKLWAVRESASHRDYFKSNQIKFICQRKYIKQNII